MKAVVTIFQFRRAVLPYLFMRYCYPVMKQADLPPFNGTTFRARIWGRERWLARKK